jgi:alpha-glucosidase
MTSGEPEPLAKRDERRRGADWWREAIVYENHLPSFRDGDGDGIGDLHGLIDALPYLDEVVGVDAVWVGPCYRSPLLDQGFDVADHLDVEPIFGDLATLDRLIAEAHDRGMKIVLDFVPNHTSDRNPWFVESRSSRDNPKRDWYVWADPAPGGGPPNNWVAEVGGSSWEWDEPTGQYYLHSHLPQQPDLNWRTPGVRKAMHDVLRFWLDRGADGFRIDVAHMLMKDPELRDNPPAPKGYTNPYELQPEDYLAQRHVNDRSHADVHDVLAEIRAVLDEYGGRVAIGEIEAMAWEAWAAYYGENGRGVHLPFAFALIETPWEAAALEETIVSLEGSLPPGEWPILAFSNHDRRRLATRLGSAQARVAAVLLLTLRGTPVLLYGDELGMRDQDVPRERQRDQFGLVGGVTHDPARTPMPWNAGPNGGFSSAHESQLWLPACHEYETINVEAQLADPDSSLNLYRRLIRLRRQNPALSEGDYEALPRAEHGCLVFSRTAKHGRALIALNLTDRPRELALNGEGTIAFSTVRERDRETVRGRLALGSDEAVVVELADTADASAR